MKAPIEYKNNKIKYEDDQQRGNPDNPIIPHSQMRMTNANSYYSTPISLNNIVPIKSPPPTPYQQMTRTTDSSQSIRFSVILARLCKSAILLRFTS